MNPPAHKLSQKFSEKLISWRIAILFMAVVVSILAIANLQNLKLDVSLQQQLPADHPYMVINKKYAGLFGSGNQLLIAVSQKQGNIFTPQYFTALEQITRAVRNIPGVDRSKVMSLVTANVRFTEIIEEGFSGGTVVPANFTPTAEMLQVVKNNVLKSEQALRLMAPDFSASLIRASLVELDPVSGKQLNYLEVAQALEKNIRQTFNDGEIEIQIVGFAQLIGDIASALSEVIYFFMASLVAVYLLLYMSVGHNRLCLILMLSSSLTILWLLALLPVLDISIHPFGVFVPFLIFAIGTSHGLQLLHSWKGQVIAGENSREATQKILSNLLLPGIIALVSDCIGFLTILQIDIPVIRDMAIIASLGVAILILSNLLVLPVLLSLLNHRAVKEKFVSKSHHIADGFWHFTAKAMLPQNAKRLLIVAALVLGVGLWQASSVTTGDLHSGVPELSETARYNQELKLVSQKFARSMDILTVYAETVKDGCIEYPVMQRIDEFTWQMARTEQVLSVNSLSQAAKVINVGWHEGNLKWFALPNDSAALGESISPVETSSGLLNHDCSVIPIYIFARDHTAETLKAITSKVKHLAAELNSEQIKFQLAGGSLAIHASTNEVVEDAQLSILLTVYLSIVILCLILFRSVKAVICVILPLMLVSILCYALMALLGIGLKISTLPVIALGAGIGVDYAIYLFHYLQDELKNHEDPYKAFQAVIQSGGKAVVFTALALSVSVVLWIFSPLKYQADMGLLLTFMFVVNMIAALYLVPALARLIYLRSS